MSVLLISLPPRRKLSAQGGDSPAAAAPGEWHYVFSSDGLAATRSGTAAAGLLPRADQVVAVVPAQDVCWQRVTLPKAAPARMRAALAGLLEEALLDDAEATHFALPPRASGGQLQWVAVLHQGWMAMLLSTLEQAGLHVDRVVPALAPADDGPLQGHFHSAPGDTEAAGSPDAAPWLSLASSSGVTHWRLTAGLSASALATLAGTPNLTEAPASWTATPAQAAAAEKWLGRPVQVRSEADALLASLASPWNLRQFELAPRMRGTRQAAELLRRLRGRDWRWARWGLVGLLLVNVIGINAWAWQQNRALEQRRQAMTDLLKTTYPNVRSVLDAPLQMQRETERLRAAAGRPGEGDLEVLIAAAASHWPDGLAPVQNLSFEGGVLTLMAPGFDGARLPPLQERLLPLGLQAAYAEGRLAIQRNSGRQP